jgi:hypothetical protein
MSVKMELLNGSSNAVKDQIIADANARTSIRDAFNALVDGASDGEYKGVLSDDLSSTEYNASYDTEYLFPVYTSVENTKQQGGSSALSLRDKCIETP